MEEKDNLDTHNEKQNALEGFILQMGKKNPTNKQDGQKSKNCG